MKRFFVWLFFLGWFLAGSQGEAFTSLYSKISVSGTFNGYSTTNNPLMLISNNVWRTSLLVGGVTNPAFLFVTNGGFGTTWKVTNQPVQPFPVSGTAVTGGAGSDITLTGVYSGTLTFQLDSATRAYWVDYAEGPWTSRYGYVNLAGSFNGYETYNTNMVMISNAVWQSYVTLATPVTNPTFVFATRNFTNTWKESNQSVYALPLSGVTEFDTGSDISIVGTVRGTLRFQFNERTGAYRVEDVTPLNQPGEPWINEFHYDNAGNDSNEFIEVAGPAGLSLTNYQLVLYNATSLDLGAVYGTTNLSGVLPSQSNGFGALAFYYPKDGLQNGANDAIALVKDGTQVVHFISYEGSVTAGSGPAVGMTAISTGVGETNSPPLNYSIQMQGTGATYAAFRWVNPTNNSAGFINAKQVLTSGPPPSLVFFSNLVHTPTNPGSNDTVFVDVDASPFSGASNMTLTAFYRVGTNGVMRPLAMSQTGTHYRTFRPIPGQPAGSVVQYHVFASYAGKGTNSPTYFPTGAPQVVQSYGVSLNPAGSVWINELDPGGIAFSGDAWEFIELAGLAGADISHWQVRLYDESDQLYSTYALPAGSILPNDVAGFGFYVLGNTAGVSGVDFPMTNVHVDGMLDRGGGIQLLNEFGVVQHSVWYGEAIASNGFAETSFVDEDFFDWSGILTGSGSTADDYIWSGSYTPSPGATNDSQILTGGNTNNLPPIILCPSNLYYSCLTTPTPTADVASVTAIGLCAGGAVTVTHVGDVTNSGSGCAGSPKIITRTYQAVSACATTSTCDQLIVYEDSSSPVLTLLGGTQVLVNAGFESGSTFGWTKFGALSNQVSASVMSPHLGFAHGRIDDPASAYAADATGNGSDGLIVGAPQSGRVSPSAALGTAFGFDGVDDRIDIPYEADLNNSTTFSFSVWVKPNAGTGTVRAVLGSLTNRGFRLILGSNNLWSFVTGTNNHQLVGPTTASTQFWTHIVGVYSNQLKQLYVEGDLVASSNGISYAPNTSAVLRIGGLATANGGATNLFKGTVDDVQIFSRALSPLDVTSIFNSEVGGPTGALVKAHLKLNETNYPVAVDAGLYQSLPASSGQTWSVSGYMMNPGSLPLRESNRTVIVLQYLNAATTVVQAVTSQPVTVSTPTNTYIRYTASTVASANVTSVRAMVRYIRDSDAAGSVYFDSFTLSRFAFDPGSNCTYTLPDLRVNVSASDSCSVISTSQTPAVGASLAMGDHDVVISALDQCGQTGSITIQVSVVDSVAPVLSASNFTVTCDNLITATTGVSVVDCSPVTLTVLSDIVSGGNGCSNPAARLTTRVLQAVDEAGFVAYATQVVSQVTTTAPSISVANTGALANAGFETGTALTNWSRFGAAFSSADSARSGSRSLKLAGQSGGGTNYNGAYQDMTAVSGQFWRASGWMRTPAVDPISPANQASLKLEFLDASSIVGTVTSRYFSVDDARDVYQPFSAQGVAPEGTVRVRLTVTYVQVTNASGLIYVDDLALNMTSLTSSNGAGLLPDMTRLVVSSNACSSPTISQLPVAGTTVTSGVTNITFIALDECGRSSTARVALVVGDEVVQSSVPPAPSNVVVEAITLVGTNFTLRSLGTNTWSVVPEYATNLLSPTWLPISNSVNMFSGGTNVTSFGYPVTNPGQGVIIRIWQRYP